jgi:hypothetical protein
MTSVANHRPLLNGNNWSEPRYQRIIAFLAYQIYHDGNQLKN